MARPFLTTRWTNLAIITYAAPPSVLYPYLPPGLDLETRDGDAFVSLVAFDFSDTRVWGVPWPGYRNFAELNLRFYVRDGEDRGIVFIREYISQRAVALIANTFYNEHFCAAPISRTIRDEDGLVSTNLHLKHGGQAHTVAVSGVKPAVVPEPGTDDHFFMELRWGFGVDRRGQAVRFEVEHAAWRIFPIQSWHVELDWSLVYGKEWEFMTSATPCSVVLSEGSPVRIYANQRWTPAASGRDPISIHSYHQ